MTVQLPDDSCSLPLLIHRWFSDGSQMRWDPQLEPHRDAWLDVANEVIESNEAAVFRMEQFEFGLLILSKVPDLNCPDPAGRERGPTILRACLLTEEAHGRISVDRTAAIRLVAVLLQLVEIPDDRRAPMSLRLSVPICEPDFRHPFVPDPGVDEFRRNVELELQRHGEQLGSILATLQSLERTATTPSVPAVPAVPGGLKADSQVPVKSRKRGFLSWLRELFGG